MRRARGCGVPFWVESNRFLTVPASPVRFGPEQQDLAAAFRAFGAVVVSRVAAMSLLNEVRGELPRVPRAGIRNAVRELPGCARIAALETVRAVVRTILGKGAFVTRSILFDKTPDANWAVPPHQDTTIAVESRVDVPGFGPWSVKDGVTHVRPPAEVHESVVTVRVHIDRCGAENGALGVVPGSHTRGYLSDDEIAALKGETQWLCEAEAGDAVVMSPLVVHYSAKSVVELPRRVLHLEFAAGELGGGVRWGRGQ